MTDIFELIDAGDVAGIERLLAAEPEAAAARDEQGLSALVRAAYGGEAVLAAVRAARPPLGPWDRLLVGESDGLPAPDSWSPDGFTPLHIAAFSHNLGATRALLAAGADPNVLAQASFARVTPLGTAATFRAVDVAAALLDGGAESEVTADHGFTPLHAAAANGDRALVELLLERGARTDARNERGQTPADLATDDAVRAVLTRC